jgi:hypothetical protein
MTDLIGYFSKWIDLLQTQTASPGGNLRLVHVATLAGGVTQLMVDEVVEWRVIFTDRPTMAA